MPYSDNACLYQYRRKGGPSECKTQVYGSKAAATSALYDSIKHGGHYALWAPYTKLYREACDSMGYHDREATRDELKKIAEEHFEAVEYELTEIDR